MDYSEIRQKVQENDDTLILLMAIRFLGDALNELVEASFDGVNTKAPSKQAIAKARGYLPPHCSMAYQKTDELICK